MYWKILSIVIIIKITKNLKVTLCLLLVIILFPLIFSLEANYGLNMKKELNNHSIDSGEVFTLTPQVYFAINPFINLNWGLKYQFNQKNRVDDKVVSNSGSSDGYLFGGSYEFSTKTVFELNYENSDTNDYSMNNIMKTTEMLKEDYKCIFITLSLGSSYHPFNKKTKLFIFRLDL